MGYSQTSEQVTLSFENRPSVTGDLLIGADGVHSKIRTAMFGAEPTLFTGMVAWRALIPMAALPAHMVRNVATNWVGPGGHVVHYPLNGGSVMNFVGTLEGNTWEGPPWSQPGTIEDCSRAFQGWHDDVQSLIRCAPSVLKWAMCGRPFLPRWSEGRVTLMGDACHPTLPFLAQGAVFTLEDAIVLQRCVSAYANHLPLALVKYEQARMERAYRMVRGASDNTYRFHNRALAQQDTAEAFINKEWQQSAIGSRYDWLFHYSAMDAEIN